MSDFGKKALPDEESKDLKPIYKAKYNNTDLAGLAKSMKKLREQHEKLDRQASRIWHEYDYLRMCAVVIKMEELGIETVTIKGVGRLNVREEAGCKTLDKVGLMDWFRSHDLDDMIQEVINASTLKAFIREQIREGNEIPGEDLIDFNTYSVASITKA